MKDRRRPLLGLGVFCAAALCALLAAGCNNEQAGGTGGPPPGPGGPMGGPGGPGGPGGRRGGPGGRGGRMGGPGGGAPLAANASPAEIYQQKCRFCHGANGEGGSGPALAGAAGKSEGDLRKLVHDGKGKMPAFGTQLSQAQINAVAGYAKQLASKK